MKRLGIFAAMGLTFTTSATALTVPNACEGKKLGGYEIGYSSSVGTAFVSYSGEDLSAGQGFVALENCKTGKALWIDTASSKGTVGSIAAFEALDAYLDSDRKFSMNGIKRGMRAKGFKVRNVSNARESCVCAAFHSGARN